MMKKNLRLYPYFCHPEPKYGFAVSRQCLFRYKKQLNNTLYKFCIKVESIYRFFSLKGIIVAVK